MALVLTLAVRMIAVAARVLAAATLWVVLFDTVLAWSAPCGMARQRVVAVPPTAFTNDLASAQ